MAIGIVGGEDAALAQQGREQRVADPAIGKLKAEAGGVLGCLQAEGADALAEAGDTLAQRSVVEPEQVSDLAPAMAGERQRCD